MLDDGSITFIKEATVEVDQDFKGECERTQLKEIFRVKGGKPTEETWPGISNVKEFTSIAWPQYGPFNLRE